MTPTLSAATKRFRLSPQLVLHPLQRIDLARSRSAVSSARRIGVGPQVGVNFDLSGGSALLTLSMPVPALLHGEQ